MIQLSLPHLPQIQVFRETRRKILLEEDLTISILKAPVDELEVIQEQAQ